MSERKIGEITVPSESLRNMLNMLKVWKGSDYDFSGLYGMKVLDLAAGTARSSDQFQPYISRLSAVHGAEVIAIDINAQEGFDRGLFTSVKADLVEVVLGAGLQSLPILQGREFDIIHSANFIGRNYCPRLREQFDYRRKEFSMLQFEWMLLGQAAALLAEGGLLTLDEIDKESPRYTRSGNNIIPIPPPF